MRTTTIEKVTRLKDKYRHQANYHRDKHEEWKNMFEDISEELTECEKHYEKVYKSIFDDLFKVERKNRFTFLHLATGLAVCLLSCIIFLNLIKYA